MATGEEAALVADEIQLNLTIEEEEREEEASVSVDQKDVFKGGLIISLTSIGGILNPPITATLDKTHTLLLSNIFHFMAWLSLAIGVFLILLATLILHRIPRIIIIAKPLTQIGWALATITLGYGSSLVLMLSFSSLVFLQSHLPYHPIYVILPTLSVMYSVFRCDGGIVSV